MLLCRSGLWHRVRCVCCCCCIFCVIYPRFPPWHYRGQHHQCCGRRRGCIQWQCRTIACAWASGRGQSIVELVWPANSSGSVDVQASASLGLAHTPARGHHASLLAKQQHAAAVHASCRILRSGHVDRAHLGHLQVCCGRFCGCPEQLRYLAFQPESSHHCVPTPGL